MPAVRSSSHGLCSCSTPGAHQLGNKSYAGLKSDGNMSCYSNSRKSCTFSFNFICSRSSCLPIFLSIPFVPDYIYSVKIHMTVPFCVQTRFCSHQHMKLIISSIQVPLDPWYEWSLPIYIWLSESSLWNCAFQNLLVTHCFHSHHSCLLWWLTVLLEFHRYLVSQPES